MESGTNEPMEPGTKLDQRRTLKENAFSVFSAQIKGEIRNLRERIVTDRINKGFVSAVFVSRTMLSFKFDIFKRKLESSMIKNC